MGNNLPQKEANKEATCYICLEPCKEGAESVELPCKHAFDRECLNRWIKEHDSCPVCRQTEHVLHALSRHKLVTNVNYTSVISSDNLRSLFLSITLSSLSFNSRYS